MLILTENAREVVKTITDQRTEADDAGLRISQQGAELGSFAVTVAEAPEPNDQLLEESGARLFLDENAVVALDHQVLDAQLDPSGGVEFALSEQA